MKEFSSIRDVLDFAISKEIEANHFYERLSHDVDKPDIKNKLSTFALDEFQHKVRLEAILSKLNPSRRFTISKPSDLVNGSRSPSVHCEDEEVYSPRTYIDVLAPISISCVNATKARSSGL